MIEKFPTVCVSAVHSVDVWPTQYVHCLGVHIQNFTAYLVEDVFAVADDMSAK